MTLTVAEIASRLGAAYEGDGACAITGVGGLRDARRGDVTFLANPRYASAVGATQASAILVSAAFDRKASVALIRCENPDAAFAQVVQWFAPAPVEWAPGVHPLALVAPDAVLGEGVRVGPFSVVEAGARIGARTAIAAQVYVGAACEIGEDGRIYPQVSLRERVRLGARVIVHNGTVIGSDGFGYTVTAGGARQKIPQLGTVVVGDDVEIGANVTIDRARFGKTIIGNGVKIDNLVQIAHNVVIGDHAVIVAQVGIAGSTMIGGKAVIAGQAGVGGHLVVGEGAIVGGQAAVTKNVPPGQFVSGYPATPHQESMRLHAHIARLPEMRERLAELAERLARLEGKPKAAGPAPAGTEPA
jgi:UDP-3-O-[3-hydroxymyristoyl] glucosamine N-acyltransferase